MDEGLEANVNEHFPFDHPYGIRCSRRMAFSVVNSLEAVGTFMRCAKQAEGEAFLVPQRFYLRTLAILCDARALNWGEMGPAELDDWWDIKIQQDVDNLVKACGRKLTEETWEQTCTTMRMKELAKMESGGAVQITKSSQNGKRKKIKTSDEE